MTEKKTDLLAFIDGGARGNPGPAAIGVIVRDRAGLVLLEEGKAIGHATNNEAEYRSLIRLLELCAADPVILHSRAKRMRVNCDSLLLVNQITGKWKIKEPRLRELFEKVQKAKLHVPFELRIRHISRDKNKDADRLVNQALDSQKN
jgi:ribonuclease HI